MTTNAKSATFLCGCAYTIGGDGFSFVLEPETVCPTHGQRLEGWRDLHHANAGHGASWDRARPVDYVPNSDPITGTAGVRDIRDARDPKVIGALLTHRDNKAISPSQACDIIDKFEWPQTSDYPPKDDIDENLARGRELIRRADEVYGGQGES